MIKTLLMLIVSLTLLTGCSVFSTPKPKTVTQFKVVDRDIPTEWLTPSKPPNPNMLKNVKVCKGSQELISYGEALVKCNQENTEKINSIREYVE